MKNHISKLFLLLILSLCLIIPTTCRKLEKSMLVSTGSVSDISTNSAEASGEIIDLGEGATQHGHCYATTPNVTISGTKTQLGKPAGNGGFTSPLTGLDPGTKYYIKAYLSNGTETVYGKEITFTTVTASPPTLSTTAITSITTITASGGGEITSDGGSPVTARGVCWNTATGPSIANSKTTDGNGTGSFTSSITGLTASTTYYVRAYATNSAGTAYGNELIFTTNSGTPVIPTLTTDAITSISETSAISGGNITSDGGASVTARGVCWSIFSNPVTADSKTTDGTGTGTFVSNLVGLSANTTYYVRAYATNSAGTAYGNEVNFTTSAGAAVIPTLTTTAVSGITTTTAASGGNISSDGGATIISRGVCWNISTNPLATDSHTNDGNTPGTFSSSITGLTPNTTYYARAYATNSIGTAYGDEYIIKTATGTVSDIEGNVYYTVTAGTQVWMAENLKTTQFSDGSDIPLVSNAATWASISTPGYCWYDNDEFTYKDIYGALYNWHAVNTGYLCPTGWHIPTDDEWNTLTVYLAGEDVAGGKLKEAGTAHWNSSNTGATNESGFTALPGGVRYGDGTFNSVGDYGNWWTITGYSSTDSWARDMGYNFNYIGREHAGKGVGFSVRCVEGTVINLPTVNTSPVSAITSTSATVGGNVTSDGGDEVTDRGVYYSTSVNAEITGTKLQIGAGTGTFSTSLEGLSPETIYYIKAYATNSVGTNYGIELSFSTSQATIILPTLSTTAITSVTGFSAVSGGNITSDGGSPVTERGVCWSTSSNPTIALTTKTSDGAGTGTFISNISSLSNNITYYVRAYATNSIGTAYGEELSFTTLDYPIITTTIASSVTTNSAVTGGNITSDGGSEVTARGVCWSTAPNPAVGFSQKTEDGTGPGVFVSNLTGLTPGTLYHIRAYATNSVGTSYGSDMTFQTLCTVASAITNGATDVTDVTATLNGTVNANNFSTEVTFEYETTEGNITPVIASQSPVTGTSDIAVSAEIAGLIPNTEYTYRVKAVNCGGTVYGNEFSFTSGATIPTLSTLAIDSITGTTAVSGGNITSDGGATIIARGVCWDSLPNPTIIYYKTIDGAGTGSYKSKITDLQPNTTYYVRAYATNSAGTAYGNQLSFITSLCPTSLTVIHSAGSVAPVSKTVTYDIVETSLSGANKCWITQNLGADNQAGSATDNTEAAAGWYWQFNRIQGYKHDDVTRTPNTAWPAAEVEPNWQIGNDPCRYLLGTGWRIPTYIEWDNADHNSEGGWANYNETYSSVLKLHAAGFLGSGNGILYDRGYTGHYWSTTKYSDLSSYFHYIGSSHSYSSSENVANGFSVRCIRD